MKRLKMACCAAVIACLAAVDAPAQTAPGVHVGVAAGTLLATTGTLLCCVLPAVLVSVGAGAVLVGLVSTFPQLVWLSERKALVFGIAGGLLALSAWMIWRARRLPCPVDPVAARSCMRTATRPIMCMRCCR